MLLRTIARCAQSHSALFVGVDVLFKKFGLFLNTPRIKQKKDKHGSTEKKTTVTVTVTGNNADDVNLVTIYV